MFLKKKIQELISRFGVNLLHNTQKLNHDILAFEKLTALGVEYTPWTNVALQPSSLEILINEIIIHRRKNIVECGSGISTVYLSVILERVGGRLISIDHDMNWINIIRDHPSLRKDRVQFVEAPLVAQQLGSSQYEWYDKKILDSTFKAFNNIDVLLVDGPPSRGLTTRYPALPYFYKFLTDDFAVFLDDVRRREEKEIFNMWKEEYNLWGRIEPFRVNVGILRPTNNGKYDLY